MVSHYLSPLTWDTAEPGGCWRAPDGCVLGLDLRSLADQGLAGSYGDWPWAYVLSETPQAGDDLIPLGSGRVDEVRPSGQSTRDAWRRCTGQQPIGDTLLDWVWSLATDQADPTGDTPLKPILPTREGNSELWLPLHSLVRSRRLAWRPGSDRYCNAVRDVLRRDLESCAAADMRPAERALDAVCRKYGCAPQEISTSVRRGRATTTVSDAFGAALTGWTTVSGTWTTADAGSGDYRLRKSNDANAWQGIRCDSALSDADHYALIEAYGDSELYITMAAAARFASSDATFYLAFPNMGYPALRKVVSGSATNLGQGSYAGFSSGLPVKCDCSGSTISAVYNGQNRVVTDTAITGNLQVGAACYYRSVDQLAEGDNFKASDGLLYKRIVGGGVI